MPLLGALLQSIGASLFGLIAALVGARIAVRLIAAGTLAGIYISCVLYFSAMIAPWLSGIFSSTYGMVLGLLFPPVSGSVLAGLFAYYTCIVGAKYVTTLTKLAIG